MSRITHRSEQAWIYDDVLSSEDFAALLLHLDALDYASVHARGRRKVWRLHDGDPLVSRTALFHVDPREKRPDEPGYPTRTALDRLIAAVLARAPEVAHLVGSVGESWEKVSFTPSIYPQGTSLSLHQDGLAYAGSFTFFAHPEWRVHWGGQLLVLDPDPGPGAHSAAFMPSFLQDDTESRRALEPGTGLAIFARPNRLVFLSPTARHLVTRVDVNAGQHARVSVAGFFHRPPPPPPGEP